MTHTSGYPQIKKLRYSQHMLGRFAKESTADELRSYCFKLR